MRKRASCHVIRILIFILLLTGCGEMYQVPLPRFSEGYEMAQSELLNKYGRRIDDVKNDVLVGDSTTANLLRIVLINVPSLNKPEIGNNTVALEVLATLSSVIENISEFDFAEVVFVDQIKVNLIVRKKSLTYRYSLIHQPLQIKPLQ